MVHIIVSALCLVVHRSVHHIRMHWGICNSLEHKLPFDKNYVFLYKWWMYNVKVSQCILCSHTSALRLVKHR